MQVTPSIGIIALYLVALGFGVAVHYSIMLSLAAVSFWIVRAQGLVYGYFNFLHIARYPDVIFPPLFRFIFGWIIPVVIVANIPARLLIKPLGHPAWLMLHLVIAGSIAFVCRAFSGDLPCVIIPAPARKDPGPTTYALLVFSGEISPCAPAEMPLIKPPLAPG